jgi:hypothetical protein
MVKYYRLNPPIPLFSCPLVDALMHVSLQIQLCGCLGCCLPNISVSYPSVDERLTCLSNNFRHEEIYLALHKKSKLPVGG